jgi:hypothetical protein
VLERERERGRGGVLWCVIYSVKRRWREGEGEERREKREDKLRTMAVLFLLLSSSTT